MTVLEKIGSPPARLGGAALYDWDYLVQEDRAHRLIYTDPAIFEVEMNSHFRRHLDLSCARKRNSARERLHHPAHGPAAAYHRSRQRGKNPRAL